MDVYMKDIYVLMTHSVVCQLAIQASTTNKQYIIIYLNHHIKKTKNVFFTKQRSYFHLNSESREEKMSTTNKGMSMFL